MKRLWFRALAVGAVLGRDSMSSTGDAARGAKLHDACLGCHGTEVYVPPAPRVKSLPALRDEVERWGDHYNPKFTRQEVEDLVAYLDRDFYRLSKQVRKSGTHVVHHHDGMSAMPVAVLT